MARIGKSAWSSIVLLIIASVGMVTASERSELKDTTPEQRAEVQTKFMTSQLGLNGEMATKISQINLEYAKKADPLIKGPEGDLKLLKEMHALLQSKDDALKGVLSEDQFEKYQSFKKQMDDEVLKMAQEQAAKAQGGS